MITFSENYTLKGVTIQDRFSARTYIFFRQNVQTEE